MEYWIRLSSHQELPPEKLSMAICAILGKSPENSTIDVRETTMLQIPAILYAGEDGKEAQRIKEAFENLGASLIYTTTEPS